MRVVSIQEMKLIEQESIEKYHLDENIIIENVGVQGAEKLRSLLEANQVSEEIIFMIGKGSNGADGLAIARHLSLAGYRCRAFVCFAKEQLSKVLLKQMEMAQAFGVTVNYLEDTGPLTAYLSQMGSSVFVDALFGTGVQLPLSNFLYDIIECVNTHSSLTVSIDIASGIEGDTGEMQGNAIDADLTMAIGFGKLGHYIGTGAKHVGELQFLDVGFPREFYFEGNNFLLGHDQLTDLVDRRDKFADKKAFGHSLILGGSHGLTGAPILAAQASLKVGSGLVTIATWEPQYQEMLARLSPEIMTGYIPLDVDKWPRLIRDLNKYSSIVIGPGLARSSRARRLVLEVINNYDGPLIIDADAINVLNRKEDAKAFQLRNAPTVLTPHLGEFCKFAGIEQDEMRKKPLQYLNQVIEDINCTVILKGPCTYLGTSDGRVLFNYFPNDGMATGGVGDVLAGILGGLLGQESELVQKTRLTNKYEIFNKVIGQSVLIHSIAGDLAAKEYGVRAMTAYSLIHSIRKSFLELEARIRGEE